MWIQTYQPLISTGSWIAFLIVVGLRYRRAFDAMIAALVRRIQAGAALKVSVVEIGAIRIDPSTKMPKNSGTVTTDDGTFHKAREAFRDCPIFIVHRLQPSDDPGQLYDVLVYIVPALRHGSLLGVKSVDYYFGQYWERKVYQVVERASGFAIFTSAYAPFSCTARINFNDGRTAFIHRLIDFEMGTLGLPRGVAG